MSALAIMMLTQVVTGAPPLAGAVPATQWSCSLETADGTRLRLSGQVDEIPAGWDPNRSRPLLLEGEGRPTLAGKASATGEAIGDHFRDYQVGVVRGAETYYINLKLRRGGAGVAHVTHYVSGTSQPYSYFAAGLCTSRFDVASKGTAQ
jgi:hypothetical protein